MKKVVLIVTMLLLVIPATKIALTKLAVDEGSVTLVGNYLHGSREALISVGHALAGDSAVYVEGSSPSPAMPVLLSSATEDFPLRRMVALNLVGFKIPVSAVARDLAAKNEQVSPVSGPVTGEPQAVTTAAVNSAETEEFLTRQAVFASSLPESVDCGSYLLPFDYVCPVSAEMSSRFGYRIHPIYGDVRFHYGTDFNVCDGEDISAFANGQVTSSGTISGYGLTLIIDHGDGYSSLYGHCSELLAAEGDYVTAGQLVAKSGHSGQVTGPHMHFELMRNGSYLNPEFYL